MESKFYFLETYNRLALKAKIKRLNIFKQQLYLPTISFTRQEKILNLRISVDEFRIGESKRME